MMTYKRGVRGDCWFISLMGQDTPTRDIKAVYRMYDSFYRGRNTLENNIKVMMQTALQQVFICACYISANLFKKKKTKQLSLAPLGISKYSRLIPNN